MYFSADCGYKWYRSKLLNGTNGFITKKELWLNVAENPDWIFENFKYKVVQE